MRRAEHVGRLGAMIGVALFLSAAVALAAGLVLEPTFVSNQDLYRVVPIAEGGFGLLREGSIDILGPDGGIVATTTSGDAQSLYLGDGGEWIGAAIHRVGAADFAPTTSFELRDRSGTRVWRIGRTEDVTYKISRTGVVVGMSLNVNVPQRNVLHFYGQGGALEAEVPLPHLAGGRFESEGSIFLALSMTEGLVVFDRHGVELWRVPGARMFAAVPGAERVAVIGERSLRMIRDGEAIAAVPLGDLLVRRVAIAPDGSRVAVAGKHEIQVYGGDRLEPLGTLTTGEPALSWTSVDVAAAGGWLVAGVARDLGPGVPVMARHPVGEVRAYDQAGDLVHQGRMEFPIWNIWTPTVILDRSGTGMTVTTRRAIYRTVLP